MKGLLLINLGTPENPSPASVKKYLAEFLMDPYVIDEPWFLRFLLVYGIILNTRPKKSAHAYQSIWTDRGSPLMYHTQDLTAKVQQQLSTYHVKFAMRYGAPSIESVLKQLASEALEEIIVIPLYPQYALASSESSLAKVKEVAEKISLKTPLKFIRHFYDFDPYISAMAHIAKPSIESFRPDHFVFSFHGVPERHVKKTDSSCNHCLKAPNCCEVVQEVNRDCYRAQSYATAKKLAARLGLAPEKYTVCFQSRLGRTPWIRPYTDEVLNTLPARGVKKVAVLEPSFVADCLETLEEIAIRGKEDFIKSGGEDLILIPSLNSTDVWVNALVDLVKSKS